MDQTIDYGNFMHILDNNTRNNHNPGIAMTKDIYNSDEIIILLNDSMKR